MSNSIFEEEGKTPVATAQQQIEKQARQLAYDTRYQVKKQIGEKKVNPAVMKRLLIQRLQKSTSAPNVKARAKQMLIGEDYIASGTEFAAESVANAMFKVFVEGKTISEETVSNSVEEAYLSEMENRGGEKFKIRVTDPKTGNSYIRYATTEKITQLRLKGLHVEKTKYGTPREDEARRGSQTASALGGGGKKKLDPVGKEDKDIDNDGDHDKSDKYLLKRRKAIGQAISTRKESLDLVGQEDGDVNNDGKVNKSDSYLKNRRKAIGKAIATEEFLADGSTYNPDANSKEIKPMKEGEKNIVKVFPSEKSVASNTIISAGTELEGPVITEKAMSKSQQRFMGMVYAVKKGEKPMSPEVAAAAEGMSKKEAKKFAKTKHKGLPEKVTEEMVDKEVRDNKAYREVIKNKFRSLGAKNPLIVSAPEDLEKAYNKIATSDMIRGKDDSVNEGLGLVTGTANAINTVLKPVGQTPAEGQVAVQRLTRGMNVVAKPVKSAIRQAGQTLGAGSDQNKQMIDKRRPQTPLQKQVAARTQQVVNQSYEPEGEMVDEARAEEKRGLGSTGAQRQRQKKGVVTSSGEVAHPATSYSGGQNPQLRGKEGKTKEQRRAASRRYVDQPGGVYAKPENKQGEGRYAAKQAKKRPDLGSRFD